MKRVLLIVFLSLPLGIAAYDHSLHPSLQKLYGAKHSQVSAGSVRIPRSTSQQRAARLRRLRGETRRQRILVLHAIIAVTNELNHEAGQANQSEEQQN